MAARTAEKLPDCAASRTVNQPAWFRPWALRRPWAWQASVRPCRQQRRAWLRRPAFFGEAAGLAAASGLAFACLTAAGLALPALAAGFALASAFGAAAASGFFAATRDFLPRLAGVCFSASAATAAISAAPGFGRPGIDRDRLGRRRRTSQQFRRLRHRRLQPGGEERHGGFAAARSAAVGGNDVRVLVAGRPLALAAAHLLAQVRRRGVDRRQIVDGAERGLQPAQPVIGRSRAPAIAPRAPRAPVRRTRRARPRSAACRCASRTRPDCSRRRR